MRTTTTLDDICQVLVIPDCDNNLSYSHTKSAKDDQAFQNSPD